MRVKLATHLEGHGPSKVEKHWLKLGSLFHVLL